MDTVLTFHKSTKNTHVYVNLADDTPIPSLYIKRAALPTTPPVNITVTVTHKG